MVRLKTSPDLQSRAKRLRPDAPPRPRLRCAAWQHRWREDFSVNGASDQRESHDIGARKASRVSFFITGTNTGVGKTHTAVQLLRLLRASGIRCAGMKPICCGDRRDAELLLTASSDGLTIDDVNPIWLKTPAAPIVGSLLEEVNIDIEHILAAFHALQDRVEHVIVEGTGGWIVPIRTDYFTSDLAVA